MEIISSTLWKTEVSCSSTGWCFERLEYMESPFFLNTFQSITKVAVTSLLEIPPRLYYCLSTLPSCLFLILASNSFVSSSLSVLWAWLLHESLFYFLIKLIVLAILLFYIITPSGFFSFLPLSFLFCLFPSISWIISQFTPFIKSHFYPYNILEACKC